MFPKKGRALILLAFFLCAVLTIYGAAFAPADSKGRAIISADILAALDQEPYVPVIIMLKEKAVSKESTPLHTGDRDPAGMMLIKKLQETARISRKDLEPVITGEIRRGNLKKYEPFWIVNAFKAEVNAAALQKIAALPQVLHITPDQQYTLPLTDAAPAQNFEIPYIPSAQQRGTEMESPPWNLQSIGAPTAWQEGITGKDVVVAIMDTGVDPNHPALRGSYRGNFPGHSHITSWYDAAEDNISENNGPCDTNGHGTHIAGIILGGSPDEPLGVAPGACWIGVNIFTRGLAWDSHIIQAFQWLMAPGGNPLNAPRIINCSWASRPEYVTDYLQWEILHQLEQAGIFTVFAAGNNKTAGPGSPASYPHAFAVGAVQKTGDKIEIADFSSRGPVQWQGISFLKPELTAPGVNIRSSWLDGGYIALDGTSLAAAHVSGAAALLLETSPELSPFEIGTILKQTASWDPSWEQDGGRPNNTYGFGTLDAWAAVQKKNLPSMEVLFNDGAEGGIMNWNTSADTPWKISREKVYTGNLAFADSPWENYKNNTVSWLSLAKPLHLKGHHSPILSFQHFHDLQVGNDKEDDYGYIEISPDNQNWLSLFRFSGSNGQFQPFSLPLNLPPDVDSFYLRFRLQSNNNGPGGGWYLDNITISALPPVSAPKVQPPGTAATPAGCDLNNDQRIDFIDLALLSLAYNCRPGDKNWNPRADLNNDGIIDTLDLNILTLKLD